MATTSSWPACMHCWQVELYADDGFHVPTEMKCSAIQWALKRLDGGVLGVRLHAPPAASQIGLRLRWWRWTWRHLLTLERCQSQRDRP